jgi:YVTN family beta-propeller protein
MCHHELAGEPKRWENKVVRALRYWLLSAIGFGVPVGAVVVVAANSMRSEPAAVASVPAEHPAFAIRLDTAPATFGENRFLVTVVDANGKPTSGAQVTLSTTMLDMPMSTQHLTAKAVGLGRYQASGLLSMPGNWRITATVRSAQLRGDSQQASFRVTAADKHKPMPALLPVLGQKRATVVHAVTAADVVRWPGLMSAVVVFLASGSVYVPGASALVPTGTVNHSIGRVPGRDEAWVTDYGGGQVAVVNLRTKRVTAKIQVGIGPVHVVFNADGARAWVTNLQTNDVSVIDVPTRRVIATVPVGLHPHGLAVSPDGKQVWVACGGNGGMWVLDARTNKVTAEVPAGIIPHGVAFSPDGKTVYMTDAGPGDLVVVNRSSHAVEARVPIHTGSAMDAVSRNGSRIFVTGQGGNVVTVVDAHTYHVVARIPVGQAPHGLVLTPDGKRLYVAVNGANDVVVIASGDYRVVARVSVPGAADEVALMPSAYKAAS